MSLQVVPATGSLRDRLSNEKAMAKCIDLGTSGDRTPALYVLFQRRVLPHCKVSRSVCRQLERVLNLLKSFAELTANSVGSNRETITHRSRWFVLMGQATSFPSCPHHPPLSLPLSYGCDATHARRQPTFHVAQFYQYPTLLTHQSYTGTTLHSKHRGWALGQRQS
jgi:hypothetical protein